MKQPKSKIYHQRFVSVILTMIVIRRLETEEWLKILAEVRAWVKEGAATHDHNPSAPPDVLVLSPLVIN